jgi:5-methylcytosine-specific restriction endonuclease McrA
MDKQCSDFPFKRISGRLSLPKRFYGTSKLEKKEVKEEVVYVKGEDGLYSDSCCRCKKVCKTSRRPGKRDSYCDSCKKKHHLKCDDCGESFLVAEMSPQGGWKRCNDCNNAYNSKKHFERKLTKCIGEYSSIDYIQCKECSGLDVKRDSRKYNLDGLCYDCNIRYKHRVNPGTIKKCKSCGKCTGSKWKWYCGGCLRARKSQRQENKRKESRLGSNCKIGYVDCCIDCGEHSIYRNKKNNYGPRCQDCTRRKKSRIDYYTRQLATYDPQKKCSKCDSDMWVEYGGQSKMCDKCKKESLKKHRRAHRHRRAAAKRSGRADGLNIDPIAVFKRDKWRCQMCGVKTHKKNHLLPDAAELDHIVPLSKGGRHIPSNVQCLCRACNQDKSDKLIGQASLFSGVAAPT